MKHEALSLFLLDDVEQLSLALQSISDRIGEQKMRDAPIRN